MENEDFLTSDDIDNIFQDAPNPVNSNWGVLFETEQVFPDRDSLIKWVRDIGRERGMIIVIERSKKAEGGKRARVWLRCERGGSYKRHSKVDPESARATGTKKCGCGFRLRGSEMHGGGWRLMVECGVHNHELGDFSHGHSFASRLTPEERKKVEELTRRNIKPMEIIDQLQRSNLDNVSTLRTIYNARHKLRAQNS